MTGDLVLRSGIRMPQLGIGTYRLDPPVCERIVATALEAGYRLIDTAAMYGNEEAVGRAVRASGVPRQELFVTTKLWNDDHGRVRAACEASLERLGLDVIDLYLMHWPVPGVWLDTWATMQELVEDGLVRVVGVSNWLVGHLDGAAAAGLPVPEVDQIELHPWLYGSRRTLVDRCHRDGIAIQAYCPLARARRLRDPVLDRIAARHQRTPAQVLIRWSLQHGWAPLPRTARPERVVENAAVWDFTLSDEELAALDGLDRHLVVSWNPERTLAEDGTPR